jgi:tellurite resistance protein TehA-like permease
MRRYRWAILRDRANGAWELVSVATSGLAIVMAQIVLLTREETLFGLGVVTWVAAIGLYVVMTWLILWRAAAAPADDIWRPHSWILMGGLAIATLAGERLHHAALSITTPDWLLDAVRSVTVVTWVVATLWILPLVYVTVRHLRPAFEGVWWAMVFPLGMYATATFAMRIETDWRPLEAVSLVFFWIGVAAWLLVAFGAVVTFWRVWWCQHARTGGTRQP